MEPFDRLPDADERDVPPRLMAQARLAYELGGVHLGLRQSFLVVPLVAIALGCCGSPWVTLALGVVLFVACVSFVSVGGELGRAVRPGLLAGAVCAAVPMGMKVLNLCSLLGCRPPLPFCLVGGLLGGAVLGFHAGRMEARSTRFLVAAGTVAALAGSLGCAIAGLVGILGMLLGVLFASTPFLLVARAR